jgi:epoxyqueuosine reductase
VSAAVPAPSSPSDLHAWLVEAARVEGFPLAGGVDIDRALEGPFPAHVRKYDEWLRAGHAGAMSYLERGRDRRADPRQVFGPAQSVFSVAVPYHPQPVGATDPAVGPRYARYVRGADYHHDLAERLDRALAAAAARLREATGRELAWKICVDTSAVLERSWAALAGLGWIGKNTLLIHPQHGSYLFIAEALVSEKLDRGPAPLPNYCGNCTRCLDACPTGAFLAPRVLDANRCLSYWTLEKRGELELSVTDARAVGTWVAGCDLCQEVCPFNFKAARSPGPVPPASGPDAGEWPLGWEAHLRETEVAYRARIKRSALSRVKPAQFRRNLALALANAAASAEEPSAFARLRPLIEERLATEPDDVARSGWRECLRSIPE